jgi:hypothetical protein
VSQISKKLKTYIIVNFRVSKKRKPVDHHACYSGDVWFLVPTGIRNKSIHGEQGVSPHQERNRPWRNLRKTYSAER